MKQAIHLDQIKEDELLLRHRWVRLKLKLTDWLERSLADIPDAEDYKGIKCVIDAIHQLEKMIGSDTDAPAHPQDQLDQASRTESILSKLPKS